MRRLFVQLFATLLKGYHAHVLRPMNSATKHGPPFDAARYVAEHVAAVGQDAAPLLNQLLQTLGFFAFLEDHGAAVDPYAWYQQACEAYK